METVTGLFEAGNWLATAIAISTCALLLVLLMFRPSRAVTRSRRPPGPPALPLIGHFHLLGDNPHQSFYKLSQQYGPLMGMRLGSVPIVVASSPSMARQILQTHDTTFANRVRTIASNHSVYGNASGITFSDSGPYWRSLRQLCAMQFFSAKRIEAFESVRTKEVTRMVRSVMAEAKLGESSALRPKLHTATNNIVSTMFFGQPLNEITTHSQQGGGNMVHLVIEVLEWLGKFNASDYLPWLKILDIQGVARNAKRTGARMRLAFQDVIDGRRALRKGVFEPSEDFLDSLLARSDITDDDIQALFLDMFGGGSDTSSLLTEWAIAELLAKPEELRRVEEEVKAVVGEQRRVREADLEGMPRLRAVVKETMRLHPVLPLLVPHRAGAACEVGGYEVEAGTYVFVNTWALSRDAEAWAGPHSPLHFCPDRFVGEGDLDPRGVHFQFLPFGSGRRTCPGWSLGLLHFQLLLASLIHAFRWASPHPPDLSDHFGIVTTKATPLLAFASPNPPATFY